MLTLSEDAVKMATLFGSVALCTACASFVPARAKEQPYALTEDGAVFGTTVNGEDKFLGLRYAQPPIGNLRWQPPQSVPRGFRQVIDGTKFGPHCPQPASFVGIASTTEDCLFLNVYTPAREIAFAARPLPVMVWIHGGGFVAGESDDYDPVRLVTQGRVVVVTLNYRLGALGVLAHPALDSEGHPAANYSILDQQAALRWVRRNVEGFGGDPGNVTVFGQSSGGHSVLANLASPGAHGLFEAAIVESGAYADTTQPSLTSAEAHGQAFANAVGCADQTATCLRGVPVERMLPLTPGLLSTTSIVDGQVLPQSIETALASGQFNHVPVMNGSNHDEGRFLNAIAFDLAGGPLAASALPQTVAGMYGAQATPVILAQYPLANYGGSAPNAPDLAFSAILGDSLFSCGAYRADVALARYVPTYAYEFNDEGAPEKVLPPVSFPYGATHSIELPFLFGALALSGNEASLAGTMVQYWTQFARSHEPAAPGQPYWPRYYSGVYDAIQSLAPNAIVLESGFMTAHNCMFWTPAATQ